MKTKNPRRQAPRAGMSIGPDASSPKPNRPLLQGNALARLRLAALRWKLETHNVR